MLKRSVPINEFVSDLRIKASTCEYGDLADELIRDRIVMGIRNDHIRKQLLKEHELSLQKAMRICQLNEHASVLSGAGNVTTEASEDVNRVYGSRAYDKTQTRSQSRQLGTPRPTRATQPSTKRPTINCKFCGRQHESKKELCPAWGQQCNACNKINHFS